MHSFAMLGDYRTTWKLLKDMRAANLSPDEHTFSYIIKSCTQAGEIQLAQDMLDFLAKNSNNLLTSPTDSLGPGNNTRRSVEFNFEHPDQRLRSNADAAGWNGGTTQRREDAVTVGGLAYSMLVTAHLKQGDLPKAVVGADLLLQAE
jgi:pentatricopeptide repeat protein